MLKKKKKNDSIMPKQFQPHTMKEFKLFYICEKLTAWMQERKSLTSYSQTYIHHSDSFRMCVHT